MKRIPLFYILTALILFPSSALAEGGYFGLKGIMSSVSAESEPHDISGSYPSVKKDFNQSGFGFALGKRFSNAKSSTAFRLELENTMRFGSGTLDHYPQNTMKTEIGFHNSTLINAYLDFPIKDVVIPYIGINAGISLLSYDAVAYSISHTKYEETGVSISGQVGLGAGVEWRVSEKISLDASARYLWAPGHEVKFGESSHSSSYAFRTDIAVNLVDFSLGLRYYF